MRKMLTAVGLVLLLLVGMAYGSLQMLPASAPRHLGYEADVLCLTRLLSSEMGDRVHLLTTKDARTNASIEQEALIKVVLNRKRLGRAGGYKDSICEVVVGLQPSLILESVALPRQKPTKRWQYMYAAASRGLRGEFKHGWPAEAQELIAYKDLYNIDLLEKQNFPRPWFPLNVEEVVSYGSHRFFVQANRPIVTALP